MAAPGPVIMTASQTNRATRARLADTGAAHKRLPSTGVASAPMGKKDRTVPRTAFVSLRDMPGTRVMFWVVDECPYCGERHLHLAGNIRDADPGETLGEYPAPCTPDRIYELALPPRPKRKAGKEERKRARRASRVSDIDDEL